MRYPNLRYGNPAELDYFAMTIPLPELARMLRRDERTVRDWISGKTRVPWWVPEYMRLWHFEKRIQAQQMGFGDTYARRFGVVTADVIQLHERRPKPAPKMTDLRLDDFDRRPVAQAT